MSHQRKRGLGRRGFLRTAAATAAAYPLLKSGLASASTGRPKRLVFYVTGQGNLMSRWTPQQLPGDQLVLSEMLEPLSAHKEKLTVLSGVSNRLPSLHTTNGHNAQLLSLMTANRIDTTGTGSFDPNATTLLSHSCLGPSIDHYLAHQMGWGKPINMMIGRGGGSRNMFHQVEKVAGPQSANQKATLYGDAYEIYNTFLAGSGHVPAQLSRADLFRSRRGAILESVLSAFDPFRQRPAFGYSLSQADKIRIAGHHGAVEQLRSEASYLPPASCGETVVDIPTLFPNYQPPSSGDPLQLDRHTELMIELAVATLKCGASNVVTLQDTVFHNPQFEFLEEGPVSGWHAQIHNDGTPYAHSDDNPVLKAGFLYYAKQFNELLTRMDAVTESDGSTMLDNSVVVWLSELSVGQLHSTNNLPIVIAGGGSAISGNRHLHRPGTNIGEFYTSLLQAFGLPDTTFGYTGVAQGVPLNAGPIPGLAV